MMKTSRFDAASALGDADIQAEMLSEALATGDSRLVAHVLGTIARARGMASVANATGINRSTLYAALSEDGNPTVETLFNVIKALDLRLTASPAKAA